MTTSRINYKLSLVIGSVVVAIGTLAWAQTSDEVLVIDQPVETDIYAAGQEVNVRSTVNGDLVAAGRRVTVNGDVAGDIIVAAQNIEIQSSVNDDVRAAGQYIRITGPVSGHVVAAGQKVTINQSVGGWAWLAGNTVEVLGNVGSNLKIRAANIRIDGVVDGDVEVIGNELDLGPNAAVRGDLRWRGRNEAEISPDAQIDGEFIEEPLPDSEELETGGGLFFTLSVIVAVMVLFLLFSRQLRASADHVATRPGMSLLLGLAVLGATPLIAVLLFVTRVGVWLGLGVLGIYLVALLLGVLTGLFAASDLALRRFRPKPAVWQSLAAILVTVVAVGLLTYVPYLGFISVLAIWLLGIGALCWNSWLALQAPRPTP